MQIKYINVSKSKILKGKYKINIISVIPVSLSILKKHMVAVKMMKNVAQTFHATIIVKLPL